MRDRLDLPPVTRNINHLLLDLEHDAGASAEAVHMLRTDLINTLTGIENDIAIDRPAQ